MTEPPFSPTTASQVSEYLLERTGEAFRTGDFALFASCFALPQVLDTFEGPRSIQTLADLRSVFDAVRDSHARAGVTDLVRHCLTARFCGPDRVEATHESRLLAGNILIQPAYPSFSVLERREGRWMVTYSQYAVPEDSVLGAALGRVGADAT